MRVLCVLIVCFLGLAYAMPPRYYAVPSQVDDDDDADVQDAPYDNDDEDSFDDMYTFPTGGPGGPPRNKFLDGPGVRQARTDQVQPEQLVSYPGKYYFSYDSDPTTFYPGNPLEDGFLENEEENPQYARGLARKDKPEKEDEKDEKDEEQEGEDEQEDEEDDDDQDDEPDYAVPDMNKLFPNVDNRPRGPGGSSSLPSRRYRYEPEYYNVNGLPDSYDTVVIDADSSERSRKIQSQPQAEEEDDEEQEDEEDDGEADDDVDFSVPQYEKLFPNPSNQQVSNENLYGNMKNTWNNAPRPPGQSGRYSRVLRLFQSPMMHDMYNPDWIIDPQIAMDRRNQRMKHRYSSPHWKRQNILTPYNYKPILYQKGHWGNPREHDYNPISGDHYLGGIYNGKTYY